MMAGHSSRGQGMVEGTVDGEARAVTCLAASRGRCDRRVFGGQGDKRNVMELKGSDFPFVLVFTPVV